MRHLRRPRTSLDARGTGPIGRHITVRASVRTLIVAVSIAAIIFAWAGWWFVGKIQEIDSVQRVQHDQRSQQLANQQAEIAQNKKDAHEAVADLVCTFFAQYPPPGTSVLIDAERKKYDCPPYVAPTSTIPAPAPNVTPRSPVPTRTPAPTVQPTAQSHSPLATRGTTTAPAAITPPVRATSPPSSAPTAPVGVIPSALCSLLGLLC